jgi:hypothetical protein
MALCRDRAPRMTKWVTSHSPSRYEPLDIENTRVLPDVQRYQYFCTYVTSLLRLASQPVAICRTLPFPPRHPQFLYHGLTRFSGGWLCLVSAPCSGM